MARTKDKSETLPSAARERILQTALQLFYSKGIRATGVDTLIAESGVAKMTFYKHFPAKQDLVLEVLKRGEQLWFEGLRSVVDRAPTSKERWLAVFDYLESWYSQRGFRGCAFINTASEAADQQADECRFSKEHKRRMEAYLAELAKDAGLRAPVLVAEQLMLLIDGATTRALLEGSAKPAQLARQMALKLVGVG